MKSKCNKIFILVKNELFKNRNSLLIWTLCLIGVTALYMGLFNSIKEMALDKIEAMPDELLAFFNMGSLANMTNYNYYFAMILGVLSIVISIYAVVQGAKSLHEEETSKTIEFLYSNSISRNKILTSKLIYGLIVITIFYGVIMITGSVIGLIVASDNFDIINFKNASLHGYLMYIVFFTIGITISSILRKNKSANMVAIAIFVSMYMIGYLGNLGIKGLDFLEYFSPINFLGIEKYLIIILENKQYDYLGLIIGIVIITFGIFTSYKVYNRKDLT